MVLSQHLNLATAARAKTARFKFRAIENFLKKSLTFMFLPKYQSQCARVLVMIIFGRVIRFSSVSPNLSSLHSLILETFHVNLCW